MVTKYTMHVSSGSETFLNICQIYSVTALDVRRINNTSTSEKLLNYQISGEKLPSGFTFKIPVYNTGSIESNTETYEIVSGYSDHKMMSGLTTEFKSSGSSNSSPGYSGTSLSRKSFDCFVRVILGGVWGDPMELPVYPQEFSDSNSASFSSQPILGRSVDHQIYTGSSRISSFTLSLHNELCDDYSYVYNLVSYIESACYPEYNSGIVNPPEIYFQIGSQFKVRGILESCGSAWKAPIIDGKLVNCDLSVSVKETTGPYSSSIIRSQGGSRGGVMP